MTEHRVSAATIRPIEFELEKAEHGMAMPYDAERAMQSAQHATRGAQAETIRRVEGEAGKGPAMTTGAANIGPNHRTLRGARRPVMAITKCPIVMPPVNRFTVAPKALSQHRRTSDWIVRSLA